MADRKKSKEEQFRAGVHAGQGAARRSLEKVEAVSQALTAWKDLLNRSPSTANLGHSEGARSIAGLDRRPTVLENRPSENVVQPISLEPNWSELPDEGTVSNSRERKASPDLPIASAMGRRDASMPIAVDGDPARRANMIPTGSSSLNTMASHVGSTPVGSEVVPVLPSSVERQRSMDVNTLVPDRPEEGSHPSPRYSTGAAISLPSTGLLGHSEAGGVPSRPDPGSVDGRDRRTDSPGNSEPGGHSDHSGFDLSSRGFNGHNFGLPDVKGEPDQPGSRTDAGVGNRSSKVARSEGMDGGEDRRPSHAEVSMSFVRNPLSSGFRSDSLSGSTFSGPGDSTSNPGGFGRSLDNPASAGSTTPQGGASGDLSRTNELLQQLIDAVRKQRGPSLPPGGPSVYSDR